MAEPQGVSPQPAPALSPRPQDAIVPKPEPQSRPPNAVQASVTTVPAPQVHPLSFPNPPLATAPEREVEVFADEAGEPVSAPAGDIAAALQPVARSQGGIRLTANEPTWVVITSDGKVIFQGLLDSSEVRTFDNVESASVLVGNAAGVSLKWNGKDLGVLGGRGQVRTVTLSDDTPVMARTGL